MEVDLQVDEAVCRIDWIEQIRLNVRHVRLMPATKMELYPTSSY